MAIVNNEGLAKSFFQKGEDIIYGRVVDIILDRHHPKFNSYDDVGKIFFQHGKGEIHKRKLSISTISLDTLPVARPLYPNIRYIPLKNEIVSLHVSLGPQESPFVYYSSVVNIWNHPHHNALPTRGELAKLSYAYYDDYDVSGNNIQRRSEDGDTGIDLGLYYSESLAIKPLIPFEGDFLLEGRFGNSIRFGSTNNSEKLTVKNHWSNGDSKTGDPITIIRNGQKGIRVPANEQEEISGWIPGNEDINGDDSSIYMTSNQVITDLKVAGLTDSEEPWITSWPSFGSEDIEEVVNQLPYEANQDEDMTEEMTDEELNQAAAGEDEIAQPPIDTDNPEEDDLIYYDVLPDNEEEAQNELIRQFCDELYGDRCQMMLLPGESDLYEIYEGMEAGSKYYYPDLVNNPSHFLAKKKLYEIMVYYDVKVSHRAHSSMKFVKEPMKMGWLGSPNYFRPHYDPFLNTIHVPKPESIRRLFFREKSLNNIEKRELDTASKTIALSYVFSELAHAVDVDTNGLFNYVKDDWESLDRGIIDLIGENDKNKTEPKIKLIPANSLYLKNELRDIDIDVSIKTSNAGSVYTIKVSSLPGTNESPKLEVEFEKDVSLVTIEKRITEITSNMLREDYDIRLRLLYHDINKVNLVNYDNSIHHKESPHQAPESQLVSMWLQDHDGREECKNETIIHVSSMDREVVEKAYEEAVISTGKTVQEVPPKKHQNTQTGEFTWRSEVWEEIMKIANSQKEANRQDNTDLSGGNAGFGGG